MQVDTFFLLFFAIGFMMLFIQRTERKRRLLVTAGMLVIGVLIVRYVNFRGLHSEAQLAFVLALIVNFLFWAIIGRYNPPKNSDDMKVLGLDD
jgi:phosphatidylserine synthase